jgi:hypothetical protein
LRVQAVQVASRAASLPGINVFAFPYQQFGSMQPRKKWIQLARGEPCELHQLIPMARLTWIGQELPQDLRHSHCDPDV